MDVHPSKNGIYRYWFIAMDEMDEALGVGPQDLEKISIEISWNQWEKHSSKSTVFDVR